MAAAILGISPGTRTVGLAVIRDGRLVEWRVKTFPKKWSKGKLQHIQKALTQTCEYYGISLMAIKKIDPAKSSRKLDRLVSSIQSLAQKRKIRVRYYTIHDLYDRTGNAKRRKGQIAEYVLEQYSELRTEYLKERNNKRQYYAKMFEAVLCTHISHEKKL
jgi:Holliday junction resolvasome RuvABC endonuclease subunit